MWEGPWCCTCTVLRGHRLPGHGNCSLALPQENPGGPLGLLSLPPCPGLFLPLHGNPSGRTSDSDGGVVVVDMGANTEPRPVGVQSWGLLPRPPCLHLPHFLAQNGGFRVDSADFGMGDIDWRAGWTVQPWAPVSLSFLSCNMVKSSRRLRAQDSFEERKVSYVGERAVLGCWGWGRGLRWIPRAGLRPQAHQPTDMPGDPLVPPIPILAPSAGGFGLLPSPAPGSHPSSFLQQSGGLPGGVC